MKKIKIGADKFWYPMPITLIGAKVGDKPTFLTGAFCSMASHQPSLISVALHKAHYTNVGIKQNGSFSVNIPSSDMVKITDYCGLVSGYDEDKSGLFRVFWGKLKTAPLIAECPLNMECKLIKTVDFPADEIFIGEITEIYCESRCLSHGLPDIAKIRPLVLSMHENKYMTVGKSAGQAWGIGRKFQK